MIFATYDFFSAIFFDIFKKKLHILQVTIYLGAYETQIHEINCD